MQLEPPSTNSDSDMDQPSISTSSHSGGDESVETELTEGDVMTFELYEEFPTLDREVVVREKVQIKKISTSEAADL